VSEKTAELTVTKGKTVRVGEREEWIRQEYSVKVAVGDLPELEVAKARLEGLIDGWLSITPKPEAAMPYSPQPQAPKPRLELPEELLPLVAVSETDSATIIRPLTYLGSEAFAKLAGLVKAKGGSYVSAGRNSHFQIPKQ